jgi:hypothetical protein
MRKLFSISSLSGLSIRQGISETIFRNLGTDFISLTVADSDVSLSVRLFMCKVVHKPLTL